MGRGWDGFRLTGELAKPNALLEQIWNFVEIGVGGFPYRQHIAIWGNFSSSIDADNDSCALARCTD
jgi:hypothetical protein